MLELMDVGVAIKDGAAETVVRGRREVLHRGPPSGRVALDADESSQRLASVIC